ncbi:MAG: hypothetical protein WCH46_02005 [bacterium]
MNIVFSVILLVGALYFVWWGYKNLVRRESEPESEGGEGVACHLCGRAYPRSQVVTVEKRAGFENYFCGDCISKLAADYNSLVRSGNAPPIFTEHVLNGDNGVVARYN